MRITKFGHSCLLVEEESARILIDPGDYSVLPTSLGHLDAIIITHEHGDHYTIDNLKKALSENFGLPIITNQSVAEKLQAEGIKATTVGPGENFDVNGVLVKGVGEWHAENHKCQLTIKNTGYFIGDRFFYPGDALTVPEKPVEILAYPAVAPWMKIAESLEYLKAVKPKVAFPVHDSFLKFGGPYYDHPERHAKEWGIKWTVIEEGKSIEV
ncbi:MAG: hypothetical protein EXS55_01990 [Candidatus Magasanikbacteria bacterium]|nr:hypothetical protein [Candidatus Magasanikbacteria bacterium]